jgi:tetratricopeptide (TPR) repeat protein
MRKWAAVLALTVTLPLVADSAKRIQEAVALYDAGKYNEAIAICKTVLAEDPSNASAAYELALTYTATGDFAACRTLIEPRLGTQGPLQAAMHVALGNCLDGAGEGDRAIATYRRGLKLAPNDHQLLYNLAVSLAARNKNDEARELLKRELRIRNDHGSGQLILAQIFAGQNFRAAAVASYLRFLSIEPQGERAKAAAQALLQLLGLGVERKDVKNITVTIDPDSPKGEGDYSPLEMGMAMASAARFTDDGEKQTEFERTRSEVASVTSMLVEMAEGDNFTAMVNVPFFRVLYDKKLIDAFAAVAILSLNLPGRAEWLKGHEGDVQAYLAARAALK